MSGQQKNWLQMTKITYLDYNSTTPLLPQAKRAMFDAMDLVGNPSSVHQLGRKCRSLIDSARKQVARALDASPYEITFTASGTEANHLALFSLNISAKNIYASATEHSSVHKNILSENLLPVDACGQIQLEVLEKTFEHSCPPKIVSIALANSETGIIQKHLDQVVALCHKYNCLVHTDAVQAFGKIPLSFKDLGVDMMTVAAHKIGGPKGAAALISVSDIPLKAVHLGGGQEKGLRSGTENIPAIVGFGVAASYIALEPWAQVSKKLMGLAHKLQKLYPSIRINSMADGLPNTLNFSTPEYEKHMQVVHFDLNGIALSSGSACSSGKVTQSHVLQALKIPKPFASSAIRISVGPDINQADLDRFIEVWQQLLYTKKSEGY